MLEVVLEDDLQRTRLASVRGLWAGATAAAATANLTVGVIAYAGE